MFGSILLAILFGCASTHTWMSCPWSFDVDPGRPANTGYYLWILYSRRVSCMVALDP